MKFIVKFIEKLKNIEPITIVLACLLIDLVIASTVLVVYGAAFVLYLVCRIVTAVAGVL